MDLQESCDHSKWRKIILDGIKDFMSIYQEHTMSSVNGEVESLYVINSPAPSHILSLLWLNLWSHIDHTRNERS